MLRVGSCPLLFAEVRAQGQERRHGRRRRRRRYRDVPSASFRQTFCLNRGNPTQEGEQVGVAFLLVTFLWPRKEKSLAKPRSGGETPSRTESSCPAWRSHAKYLVAGQRRYRPLTLALSRKGRGDSYRGRLRCVNRPYRPYWRSRANTLLIAPLTIDLGKGVNRRPSPYYGARVVLSMVLMS